MLVYVCCGGLFVFCVFALMNELGWEPLCGPIFFLCISVLRVASGPGVGLAGCGDALVPPVVCSAGRSRAVVPVLVLLFGALWFILRDDLLCVLPCAVLFLCFSVLLALRLPRLGKWRGGGGGRVAGGGGWSSCFLCVWSICVCLGLSVSSSS